MNEAVTSARALAGSSRPYLVRRYGSMVDRSDGMLHPLVADNRVCEFYNTARRCDLRAGIRQVNPMTSPNGSRQALRFALQ